MSSLLRAELLRLASRRLLVMMLVAMAALAALGVMVSADLVKPVGPEELISARENIRIALIDWESTCGGNESSVECADWPKPQIEEFMHTPLGFGEYAENALDLGFPLVLVAVAALVASLIGAEFASGNLSTQLLFTPRRIPLLLAKLAVGCVAGIVVAATYVLTSLALSAITFLSLRGAHDMSAGVGLPLMIGRIMVLVLILALMSGALTMGLGSSLITMGVYLVVLVGSWTLETVVRGSSWVQFALPSRVLMTMMAGQTELYDWWSGSDDIAVFRYMNYDWALAYSVIGVVIIAVTAAWWFRRRDLLG
ncbi:MAG: hypothetical protein Q4P15_02400 [Propionibacteriaceae bacterium]|nr:hypothetical protein [Propionibacteriaceae bacterium]